MQEPNLYSIVDRMQLKDRMDAFQECMDLPIQLIDERGIILQSCGKTANFCNKFRKFLPSDDTCEMIHSNAGKRESWGNLYFLLPC